MKRELWADYVKVVAIFLMQMCHFHLASIDATIFIYMFHMPVFFFVSGYFDKGKSISKDIILKNVRTLIVPYVFFSLLSIPFFLSVVVRHPELYGYNPIYQQILKMIIGIAIMDDTIKPFAFLPCPELWFLVALFWVRISFSLLFLSVRKQGWVIFLFVIFMFSIGLIYRPPYFSWDSACFAFPFYIVGYITKRNELLKYFANRLVCVLSVFFGHNLFGLYRYAKRLCTY